MAARLEQQRCALYSYDVRKAHCDTTRRRHFACTEPHPSFEHSQYSVEFWINRALLQGHSWVVPRIDEADLIHIPSNFSRTCVSGRRYAQRMLWDSLSSDKVLWPNRSGETRAARGLGLKLIPLQYGACPAPWRAPGMPPSEPPDDLLLLVDKLAPHSKPSAKRHMLVTPFVVSSPPWLVGAAAPPDPPVRWAERRLLFFAGHIPKLYISTLRYALWRQLRSHPSTTVSSSTLLCTVGAFSVCRRGLPFLREQSNAFLTSHCLAFCPRHAGTPQTYKCGASDRRPAAENLQHLLRMCSSYATINYTAELPLMRRDTRQLNHSEYLRLAMSHRFCLVAPGDFTSTHKISETVAIGAAGGCLPVLVLPGPARDSAMQAAHMLPYSRWLNWCDLAYFVAESDARRGMAAVLRQLEHIGAAEALRKRRALRAVRDAFVFRKGSTVDNPSATEYILAEACAAARQHAQEWQMPFASDALMRCTLPTRLEHFKQHSAGWHETRG